MKTVSVIFSYGYWGKLCLKQLGRVKKSADKIRIGVEGATLL